MRDGDESQLLGLGGRWRRSRRPLGRSPCSPIVGEQTPGFSCGAPAVSRSGRAVSGVGASLRGAQPTRCILAPWAVPGGVALHRTERLQARTRKQQRLHTAQQWVLAGITSAARDVKDVVNGRKLTKI